MGVESSRVVDSELESLLIAQAKEEQAMIEDSVDGDRADRHVAHPKHRCVSEELNERCVALVLAA